MRFDSLPGRDLAGGLRIVEATTRRARGKGLARLDDMPATLALHLVPCRSVHTFGMRFALDLIWLDRDGDVVRVDTAVPPAAGSDVPARAVGAGGARGARGRGSASAQRDGRDAEHDQD